MTHNKDKKDSLLHFQQKAVFFILFVLTRRWRALLLGEGGERLGFVDGHLGEHLAVHLNTGKLQAVHEAGVVHPFILQAALILVIHSWR